MPSLNEKNALLIHPLGRASGRAARVARLANIMPPLGVASMAAYAETRGIATAIIDYYAQPDSDAAVKDYLRERRPAFVGFSCTTATFLDGVRIARMVKSELPGVSTVFGGVHVSGQQQAALERFPELDFAIVGEGEQAFCELLESQGRDVGDIPGLVYRQGGQVLFSGLRKKGIDLDSLPFPAYDKLPDYPHSYTLPIFNYPTAPNTSANSSRGCPYTCSYCDRSVFRSSYRFNSAEYLYAHMKFLKERYGIRHINFYDDQFTFNRRRVEEFTDMLVDKPLGMTFNCAVRANHVDEDLLRRIKAAGGWMVSLGVESGDQELLERHGRKLDVGATAEVVRQAKRAGLRVKGLLMMGVPGETEESIQRTMDYAFSLPIDDFNMTKFTPFPGAPLYDDIRNHGAFEENWDKMDCMHFLFIPHALTKERMETLFTEFYKRHYTRPRAMWDKTTMLWRSPDSWRRFLGNLGEFLSYARKGDDSGRDSGGDSGEKRA